MGQWDGQWDGQWAERPVGRAAGRLAGLARMRGAGAAGSGAIFRLSGRGGRASILFCYQTDMPGSPAKGAIQAFTRSPWVRYRADPSASSANPAPAGAAAGPSAAAIPNSPGRLPRGNSRVAWPILRPGRASALP